MKYIIVLIGLIVSVIPNTRHDYHVSYTNMVVEDKNVVLNIRLFKDDFEKALQIFSHNSSFQLQVSETADAVVMDYFRNYLKVKVRGRNLRPTLVSSGESGEMWSFVLSFQARQSIQEVEVYHAVLMRLFNDQRNIFKLLFLPEQDEHYFYYVKDSEVRSFRKS